MPLLFAAWERFAKEDFARVLKLVSVIAFRYSVVSGLNTNELEPVYHHASKSVLDGTAPSVARVFEILQPIYVSDERFKGDFSTLEIDTSGQGRRLARYVLFRLERDASNFPRDYESDPGTIEHILPENPPQVWEATFAGNDWPKYAYRVGNLTLLEAASNRAVGNGTFAEKRAAYAQSQYRLTIAITEEYPDEWTTAAVDARQGRLAERAAHVWRSDYARGQA